MRRTTSPRQAAERLAEYLGARIERVNRTQATVSHPASNGFHALRTGPKTAWQLLGYLATLALDVYGHDPADVRAAVRLHGYHGRDPGTFTFPSTGCGAHDEYALQRLHLTEEEIDGA